MKVKTLIFNISMISLLIFQNSCSKSKSCFDAELYESHKDALCTMDCPGVTGCDGQTYCNECVANAQGIKIVK